MKISKYCSYFPTNKIIRGLILTVTTLRDVFLTSEAMQASS
uniref:Uncharacterized protein n=1 Tax=Trichinella nativa TaxID=6335 RepID=A0A0V1JS01_9BILA